MAERRGQAETPTPAAVQESAAQTVARLEREQLEETATLAALNAQKARGVRLDKDGYVTLLMLQDSIEIREQELAQAERQLRRAQWAAEAQAAFDHYEGVRPAILERCDRVVGLLVQFHRECAELGQAIDAQIGPLSALIRADGSPAFDLEGGRTYVDRLLRGLPYGDNLVPYLRGPGAHRPSVGEARQALDAVAVTKALNPRLIQRTMEEFEHADL